MWCCKMMHKVLRIGNFHTYVTHNLGILTLYTKLSGKNGVGRKHVYNPLIAALEETCHKKVKHSKGQTRCQFELGVDFNKSKLLSHIV